MKLLIVDGEVHAEDRSPWERITGRREPRQIVRFEPPGVRDIPVKTLRSPRDSEAERLAKRRALIEFFAKRNQSLDRPVHSER